MKKNFIILALLIVWSSAFSQSVSSLDSILDINSRIIKDPIAICTPNKDTVFYPENGRMTGIMLQVWIQDTSLVHQSVTMSTPYKASGWYFKSKNPLIVDTYVFVIEDKVFENLISRRRIVYDNSNN